MGIVISRIRLRNFRSYKNEDIEIPSNGLLIGSNNAGKTTLLRAFQVAFERGTRVSSEDIYLKKDEKLSIDKKAIIDVLIKPDTEEEFDDIWFELFGELRSEDPDSLNQFVALRSIIKFNLLKGEYDIERKALTSWPISEEVEDYKDYSRSRVTDRVLQSIPVFYLDAKRDISSEMKDRYSYWGKLVGDVDLSEENISDFEKTLNQINEDIIENSTVLKHLSKNLNLISKTVKSEQAQISINPVSRKIRDLSRGMDITYRDQEAEGFSISNHGMGTRSWITFLTLVSYIEWKTNKMKEDKTPYHPIILLEEPEAHLHPQAQRKIFNQIKYIEGQKLISTHSPIIAAQTEIQNILHVSKHNGMSCVNYIDIEDLKDEEIRKIRQEVFKTRGDLLFANAIILCEGETEEQVLPTFFKEYFGCEFFELGINIISVNGFGKYKPFLQVAKDLKIHFYILSDGEERTINALTKEIRKIFGTTKSIKEYKNIKFLPNQCDFESYLLDQGYDIEINIALEKLFGKDYLNSYIKKNDGTSGKSKKTNEKCPTCHQNIFKGKIRDYKGDDGVRMALLDCIHDNKTAYSSIIGEIIVEQRKDSKNKIPQIIEELFKEINNRFKFKSEKKEGQEYVSIN